MVAFPVTSQLLRGRPKRRLCGKNGQVCDPTQADSHIQNAPRGLRIGDDAARFRRPAVQRPDFQQSHRGILRQVTTPLH